MLCSGDSGKELSFSGAGVSYGLRLASVGDGTSAVKESIACSRSVVSQIIGAQHQGTERVPGDPHSERQESWHPVWNG